jgi:hypothetical protein
VEFSDEQGRGYRQVVAVSLRRLFRNKEAHTVGARRIRPQPRGALELGRRRHHATMSAALGDAFRPVAHGLLGLSRTTENPLSIP